MPIVSQGTIVSAADVFIVSASSIPDGVEAAGSYWAFSRRVIIRSLSSPKSPPIIVGSPTTITSDDANEKCGVPDGEIKTLLLELLLAPIALFNPAFDFLVVAAPVAAGTADGFLFLLLLVAARLSSPLLNL